MAQIAPSILSADFLFLSRDIEMINNSEADWFHLDVMDGRFVPNISFGLPVIAAIKREAKKPLDVHLMIEEPGKYAEEFKKAGADHLTVHIEACPHLHRNLQQIKSLGMKAGVAINPHTPVHFLFDILHEIDIVCMMSVNPGFGGQQFIHHILDKIKTLKAEIVRKGTSTLIEIDGGVTEQNAAQIANAGADVLVAGNTVFSAANPIATIANLKLITA
jgi:ribulose-phosphate 3-epimerase